MPTLQELHQQSYSDMPFDDFAKKFHAKHYADMPFGDFLTKVGGQPAPQGEQQGPPMPPQQPGDTPWYSKFGRAADDMARITADSLTFGGADHLAGYLGGNGVEAERALTDGARERAGGAGFLMNLLSGAAVGSGIANAGATAARLVPSTASGLKGAILRGGAQAVDGAALGAVNAAGHGEDVGTGAMFGAGTGALGSAAGDTIMKAVGKVGQTFNRPAPAQSSDTLKETAQAAYRRADDAGVILTPDAMKRTLGDAQASLADFGYHPALQPRIAPVLDELQRVSEGPITAKGVDVVRRIAGSAAKSQDPSERSLAQMIIGKIDDTMADLKMEDVIAGDANAASSALKEARDLYRRQAKMGTMEEALLRGERNAAAAGSGGNADNATRQQFKSILNSKTQRRGFTDDEISAMERIVSGTPTQNTLRLVGKLSPGGNGLMAALGIGATAVNPAMAALPAAGFVSKALADRGTRNNVQTLAQIISAGGSRAAATPAPNALQRLAEAERNALVRAITGGTVALRPWGD
jgi:hypothetical protein